MQGTWLCVMRNQEYLLLYSTSFHYHRFFSQQGKHWFFIIEWISALSTFGLTCWVLSAVQVQFRHWSTSFFLDQVQISYSSCWSLVNTSSVKENGCKVINMKAVPFTISKLHSREKCIERLIYLPYVLFSTSTSPTLHNFDATALV